MSRHSKLNYKSHLLKYLRHQSNLIVCMAPQVFIDLSGKSVHELRRAIRRVRSTLWLLGHSSAHLDFQNCKNNLHRLEKALGVVRELDVAILDATQYSVDQKQLEASRTIAKNKLKILVDLVHQRKIETLLAGVEQSVQAEDFISLKGASRILHSRLKNQIKRHFHSQKKLHTLRVSMKRTQYVLEAMGKPVKPIKRLQHVLGDMHDLEYLQTATGTLSRLKKRQHTLKKKSARLIKPVLRFAADELN